MSFNQALKLSLLLSATFMTVSGTVSPYGETRNTLDVLLQQELATPCPVVDANVVQLTFPPGDIGSDPHVHPGPVIGYVLQGYFLFQVNNGTRRIIGPGGTFAEREGDVHTWSANASNDETCKVVATVYGRPGKPLLTFVPNYPRESRDEALRLAVPDRNLINNNNNNNNRQQQGGYN